MANVGGVRCDWLNVSFPLSKLDEMREYVAVFEGSFVDEVGGVRGYKSGQATQTGVRLAWSEGRSDALLSMPGKAKTFASWLKLRGVLDFVAHLGGRCSRIDLAFDDTTGIIDMSGVARAAASGELQDDNTLLAAHERHFVGMRKSGSVRTSDGRSFYFGTRGGNGGTRSICIYDKGAEQRLKGVKWNRLEVRFQNEGAAVVMADLHARFERGDNEEAMKSAIARLIAGSIDFREPGNEGDYNLGRRARFAWWQRVVDELGEPQRLTCPIEPAHVEKFAAWLNYSLGPGLAYLRMLTNSFGDDFSHLLLEVLDNNESRVRWQGADARTAGVTRERLRFALGVRAADEAVCNGE